MITKGIENTKKLRAELDARGVKHRDDDRNTAYYTAWEHGNLYCSFSSRDDGRTSVTIEGITPEQAVAATLGAARGVHV